jgi:hypothetical protein
LLHCIAAIVPSLLRGDWETASAHIRMAAEAAEASRARRAIAAAFLAMARGDLEGVADVAAAVRHRQGGVPGPPDPLRVAVP